MKIWLQRAAIIAALFFCAQSAEAQTSAVSGNVQDVGVANITSSNTFVRFELRNYGSQIPAITGSTSIGNPIKDFPVDTSGNFAGTVYRNDAITPSNTHYRVCVWFNNREFRCNDYRITNPTFELSTATPITSVPAASSASLIGAAYTHVQSPAATTWTITHSFGTNQVLCQFFDSASPPALIWPDTVVLTSTSTVTATYSTATAGQALCFKLVNFQLASSALTATDLVLKVPGAEQEILNFPIKAGSPGPAAAYKVGNDAEIWDGNHTSGLQVRGGVSGNAAHGWIYYGSAGTTRIGFDGTSFILGSTASNIPVLIQVNGTTRVTVGTGNITLDHPILFATDNAHDVGATSSSRPRNLYVANKVTTPTLENGAAGLTIQTTAASDIILGTNSVQRWNLTSAGHWLAAADGQYDIGTSANFRPRDVFVQGKVVSPVFSSSGANPATVGLFRGIKGDSLRFRNSTNSFDVIGILHNSSTDHIEIGGLSAGVKIGDNTTVDISNVAGIKAVVSGTATLDFPNLGAAGCNDLTIAVTGAAVGATVHLGVPNGSVPNGTAFFTGWVSASDVVTVRHCNLVSGDPASGTFRATVIRN